MRQKQVLIAVLVVVAAVVAGAAYFLLAGGSEPKIVNFIGQKKQVIQDATATSAPKDGAEIVARLSKGMSVDVDGIIEGGAWSRVTLPDSRHAYLPVVALDLPASAAGQQASGAGAIDDGPPVEFEPASDVFVTTHQVTVYIEPNLHAPPRYQLDAGAQIPAIARSKDGVWVQASTEDGTPAFLQVADLGEAKKGKPVILPQDDGAGDLPESIDGAAKVVNTSVIEVGGQKAVLAWIIGSDEGTYVQQLQGLIDAQGGNLHCAHQTRGYLCKLPSGIDVALSALYNGGARPADDAPPAYQNQAKSARAAHRGVWQQ